MLQSYQEIADRLILFRLALQQLNKIEQEILAHPNEEQCWNCGQWYAVESDPVNWPTDCPHCQKATVPF